ncbi:hypothetical protein M3Y98_00361800 [Aphelenchoides besseyi]|nr:hypothetical protein M3Y98_00361800 [Aphelenchoides besseyi]KAI6201720.1 hypothetical protein M3Y96_00872400 [Aphelenchoides besseyi]
MDRILPPPPTKSRNESMSSNLPTYRNRPSGSANTSHFANAKSMFESLNSPALRNGISQLAKNPLAQRAAASIAKNDAARTAMVNASYAAATGREPDALTSKVAHGSIMGMVKQFENKPIMGMGSATSPTNLNAGGDHLSQHSASSFSFDQKVEPSYNTLTAIDPFEYPPQLPSSQSNDYANRSKSSEPFSYGGFSAYEKKPAPSRPPPPRSMSNSWSNPNIASPVEQLTNQAHGIAKYPYCASQADEVNCDPGDTLLLDYEVDDQWVHATNTRTGASGILPVNFLDIRIPLAPKPSNTLNFTSSATTPASTTGYSSWGNKQLMKAIYDFQSDVSGDLNFKAGDLIVVHEKVNDEWYNGELNGKFGIFPSNYVQTINSNSSNNTIPTSPLSSTKTVTALYDYNSGVPEDLQFKAGDVIEVVSEVNADWISGRLNNKTGLLPLTYVQRN